jgi:hypothetical protein
MKKKSVYSWKPLGCLTEINSSIKMHQWDQPGGKMIQGNVKHGESRYERSLNCCKIAGGIVEIWKSVSVLISVTVVCIQSGSLRLRRKRNKF